jgi:hydroxyacylglutathione hydrolase
MVARSPLSPLLAFVVAALLLLTSLGCATSTVVGQTPRGAPVVQIPLRLSNVFLIESKAPILIDSGTVGDKEDLVRALQDNGVWPSRIGLIILTHGHADHAGLASDLRTLSGAPIMIGQGDLPLVRRGYNDVLHPTSVTAALLKPVITSRYQDFEPDILVTEPVSLAPWGIDGKVVAMPGHTQGSLVVILSNDTAFVGDMMLGGALGGIAFSSSPGEHYFQADREANRRNIEALVRMGIRTFYLGHGGPVSRYQVIKAFAIDPSPH